MTHNAITRHTEGHVILVETCHSFHLRYSKCAFHSNMGILWWHTAVLFMAKRQSYSTKLDFKVHIVCCDLQCTRTSWSAHQKHRGLPKGSHCILLGIRANGPQIGQAYDTGDATDSDRDNESDGDWGQTGPHTKDCSDITSLCVWLTENDRGD